MSRRSLSIAFASDLGVCQQQDPGVAVSCDVYNQRWVGLTCDSHGRASFRVVGHADHAASDTNAPSLRIYADGLLSGTVPVAAFDQDGIGLGPADNSLCQADYFSDQYWERSDLDGDGVLGPADLSLWLDAFFGDGSLTNCVATACP